MIRLSTHTYDYHEFNFGDIVNIRKYIDANKNTKKYAFYDHLNKIIYRVYEIIKHNKFSIIDILKDVNKIVDVNINRLTKFNQ